MIPVLLPCQTCDHSVVTKYYLTNFGCLRTIHTETVVPEATSYHKSINNHISPCHLNNTKSHAHLLSTVATKVFDLIWIFCEKSSPRCRRAYNSSIRSSLTHWQCNWPADPCCWWPQPTQGPWIMGGWCWPRLRDWSPHSLVTGSELKHEWFHSREQLEHSFK